jgi:HSP90 family molecular chaperone
MLRLSSRLLEILEASISRVRKSIFEDSGRAVKEFTRFKSTLHKILKREYFVVKDFVEHIINYCSSKYKKQFTKLQKYVERVKEG